MKPLQLARHGLVWMLQVRELQAMGSRHVASVLAEQVRASLDIALGVPTLPPERLHTVPWLPELPPAWRAAWGAELPGVMVNVLQSLAEAVELYPGAFSGDGFARQLSQGSRGRVTYANALDILIVAEQLGLIAVVDRATGKVDPELLELERFLRLPEPATELEAEERCEAARRRYPDAMRRLGL